MYNESATDSVTPPAPAAAAPPAAQPSDYAEPVSTAPANAPYIPLESMKAQSWGAKVYHGVLDALGGSNDVHMERDPNTGKMNVTTTKSGPGTQWKRIIAGAITGGGAAMAGAGRGPGAGMRSAGLGVMAGEQQAEQGHQQQRQEANEDYDVQQKTATANANRSMLSFQVAKGRFELDQQKMVAKSDAIKREVSLISMLGEHSGAIDMGVIHDGAEAMKMFKDDPRLHGHLAEGQLIPIDHVNPSDGTYDGLHVVWVPKPWLEQMNNQEIELPYTKADGTKDVYHVPSGGMSNSTAITTLLSQSKEAQDEQHKIQQDKADKERADAARSQAASQAARVPAENALDYARGAAAASGNENELGIGGKTGFLSWYNKIVVPVAQQTETSYRLAAHAHDEYYAARAKGQKLASGAPAMQMLSQHIATTFGSVKGARITKDMISKHLGARSVSDDLEVAVNHIVNGEELSKNQWDAFGDLISERRNESWNAVLDSAIAQGRPLDRIEFPADFRSKNGLPPGRTLQTMNAPAGQAGGGAGRAAAPWTPPADAPAAPAQDNKVLKDGQGNVIAKSAGGKWVQP
jgi:hypothetical protein